MHTRKLTTAPQPKAGLKKGEIMQPIISIIMGSKSDWETMKKAAQVLEDFGVVYEKRWSLPTEHQTLCFDMLRKRVAVGLRLSLQGLVVQLICRVW